MAPEGTSSWPRTEPARSGPEVGAGVGAGWPPPGGPPAHAAPARRRRPRLRWVLAGLGVVVAAVLLAPAPLVDPFVNRAAGRYQGRCAEFSGVEVHSGSWPAVIRAAAGRLRGVSAHTDEVRFDNDLTIHDVDFSAEQVNVAPLRFGLVDEDAEVRGGRSSATVLLDDIERILAGYGVTVDLRGQGASLVADVDVPFVGVVPTTVDLVPIDGDLELRFAALDLIPLPSLLVAFPEPVALQGVNVRGDGLRVSTSVDGTITSDDWGCDASAEAPS